MGRLRRTENLAEYWAEINRLENEAEALETVSNSVETIAVKEP